MRVIAFTIGEGLKPHVMTKSETHLIESSNNLIRDNIARFNRKIILPQRPDSQHNEKLTVSLRTGLLCLFFLRII